MADEKIKIRLPDTQQGYHVRLPDNYVSYKIRHPEPGGGPTLGSLEVDTTGTPSADWKLRNSASDLIAQGPGDWGPVEGYSPDTYTLTWEDTVFGGYAPSPDVDVLAAGGAVVFGPPTYPARESSTITVDVIGPPTGEGPWDITASSPFSSADYSEAGSGDGTAPGTIYHGRTYSIDFDPTTGWSPPSPNPGNITADKDVAQEFVGTYTASGSTTRDLDAEGWTLFFPSGNTRQVHVSNSGNDTTGDGSIGNPYATIAEGASDVREGYSDWLLLRRGDTWAETTYVINGRSRTEPTLYSTYGTGDRPIIKTPSNNHGLISDSGSDVVNFCVVGWHYYATWHDPSHPDYEADVAEGSNKHAITWEKQPDASVSGVLFEDCWLHFYCNNNCKYIELPTTGTWTDMEMRRCLVTDNWRGVSHSQGFYTSTSASIQYYQCIFDHNGWLIQGQDPGQDHSGGKGTIYNHSWYWHGAHNMSATECVSTKPSSIHFKSDTGTDKFSPNTTATNNLLVDGEVVSSWGGRDAASWVNAEFTDNVCLSLGRSQPTGRNIAWGIGMRGHDGCTISGNIFAHWQHPSPLGNCMVLLFEDDNAGSVAIDDNVIYNVMGKTGQKGWVAGLVPNLGAGVITISNNVFQNDADDPANPTQQDSRFAHAHTGPLNGSNFVWSSNSWYGSTTGEPFKDTYAGGGGMNWAQWQTYSGESGSTFGVKHNFVHNPVRSIETYMESIGEAPYTIERFIELQRGQSKETWRLDLTAPVINDWVRAGFAETP